MVGTEALTVAAPESVTWRIHLDRAMWVAGVRALMLQALHPVAMQGVWQRSDFMTDPTGRLLRTADFVAVTTYGTPAEAEEFGWRVRDVHRRLSFTDPRTGRRHRVDEPELLLWVHCAEVVSYLEVVRRSGVRVSRWEADRYFAEQRRTAGYVGLAPEDVPGSVAEMRRYLAGIRPRLRVTEEARAAVRFLLWPKVPQRLSWLAPLKPLWLPLGCLAYYSLPAWARHDYRILPEPSGVEASTTLGLGALRALLYTVPTPLYNQLFDEATVLRAREARRRLEAVGYDFGGRLRHNPHGVARRRAPGRGDRGGVSSRRIPGRRPVSAGDVDGGGMDP